MATLSASVGVSGLFQKLSLDSSTKSRSAFFASEPALVSSKTEVTTFVGPLTIEAAHKKGAGSTKNGRDSNAQRLGVKVYGDQPAKAGSIIIRQRGTKIHPGNNVGLGKDYTIFSLIDGVVKFEKYGIDKKKVSVYAPTEEVVENPNSRRIRKRDAFRLQRERRRQAMEDDFGFDSTPLISIASATPAASSADEEQTAVC